MAANDEDEDERDVSEQIATINDALEALGCAESCETESDFIANIKEAMSALKLAHGELGLIVEKRRAK